ncbi:MAG: glycerophosphodiester phosphodiesterase [Actinomycetes bacterium]
MSVITFAHRGGRAHAPENTLEAFRTGLAMGAAGLESDVWVAADGQPVLVHDDRFWAGVRRVDVKSASAADLARHGVPRLADLYVECGRDFELSLDLKERAAIEPTIAVVRSAGDPARTWLCGYSVTRLTEVRQHHPDVRLVNSRPRDRIDGSVERHAARLAEAGIDAMNMRHDEWNAGLVALFHRFGVQAFAWDVQHVRTLRIVLDQGVDAVYSDRVDRMVATVSEWQT